MKTLTEAHLLLNPVAGNGQAKKIYHELKQILLEKGIPFTCKISQKPKHLITLANEFANQNQSQTTLIVIGGDGSLNEALNGIKSSNYPDTPIAYLPAGSGNDFARAAHLSKDPRKMIDSLTQQLVVKRVDCGQFTTNLRQQPAYFVNNFGIGFDAFVVHESNNEKLKSQLNKLHLGSLIYPLNIVNVLRKQDTFQVEITANNRKYHYDHVYFVTTTNHPYFGGGIAILPKANIENHVLDTVIVQKPNLRKFIHLFYKLLRDGSHVYDPHFHYIEAKRIAIKTERDEFAQIDGEDQPAQNYELQFKIASFNLII